MKNVLEFLERTVTKYPDHYAVEDNNLCFTWRELQQLSQIIGSFLCKVSEQLSVFLDDQWKACVLSCGNNSVYALYRSLAYLDKDTVQRCSGRTDDIREQ